MCRKAHNYVGFGSKSFFSTHNQFTFGLIELQKSTFTSVKHIIASVLDQTRQLKVESFQSYSPSRTQKTADTSCTSDSRLWCSVSGEKPVCSQQRLHSRLARSPCARSTARSDVTGERRSPKVISVSVYLLHKIFTSRKDELVKDLPAT